MKVKFTVTGMHCGRCCSTIEAALKVVPGFQHCSVGVGVAEVDYDESRAGKSDFIAAIQAGGTFDIERLETIS
jgi:copper chaperone CopZ